MNESGVKYSVQSHDDAAENIYETIVDSAIDQIVQKNGDRIFYDFDGTVRGNALEAGIGPYIRKGFIESFNYAKVNGLKVSLITNRKKEFLPNLKEYDLEFDEIVCREAMMEYVKTHPFNLRLLNTLKNQIKFMFMYLQANSIKGKTFKLVYLVLRMMHEQKEYLLVDDDTLLGTKDKVYPYIVTVPLPNGYKSDYKKIYG